MKENNPDDFWKSLNDGARREHEARKGNFPREGVHDHPNNYEILPIQELRLQAEKLKIPDFINMNKQELIE